MEEAQSKQLEILTEKAKLGNIINIEKVTEIVKENQINAIGALLIEGNYIILKEKW